ncbi:MAG: polysaccharide lyase family protein [Thermoguttaceae bacterium]
MRCEPLLALLLASSTALAAEQTVWQIGKPDHSYREFACAGDYRAYARQFGGKPVVFEVGRSDAGRDWPFIQAGPNDDWCPARGQPRVIRFDLPEEPRGIFTLSIDFADVQGRIPPRYAVSIGERTGSFQLSPGGGDASLSDPAAGKPQQLQLTLPAGDFKKGRNEIRLACVEGSWVQYDSIRLVADPEGRLPAAEVRSISARPTPFFVRRGEQLRRVIGVSVALTAPAAEVLLRVEAAGQTSEVPLGQLTALGSLAKDIDVPDSDQPIDVKITAVVGGRSRTTQLRVMPERKWKIYTAPSSHTDIGYTDIQENCAKRHCQNIDTAIDLIRRFPDFRWNLEVAWQAENYVRLRTPERLAEFYRLAREGKIGIQALYCNILTGLCSHEEACRLTWYAHKLCHEKGLPYKSAMISDVPTQEASLPMLLSGAGIRYFSSGINNDRAYNFTQMQQKCPCWWEGPDGSRVLMMYTWQYAQASQWALTESLDAARARVLEKLREYDARKDYPYDAVFLHGAVSDNCPLDVRLAEVAKQWNERYEYPKVILSHNAEFFEYIEKKYGDKLAVYRGSAGTYWEDGAGSSAHETALTRGAHERLSSGQKLLALADRIGRTERYRPDDINQAWRNCLLYDEHTWGAYCSISEPDKEFTKAQWKVKAQFAVDADRQARAIFDSGGKALAGLVRTTGPALVVFNPASWPRTDILRVDLPEGQDPADPALHAHRTAHGTFLLLKDVPACGYCVVPLGPKQNQPAFELVPDNVLESRFYRVELDPASGGIASIFDKELKCELVDAKAPFRLNQYVYVGVTPGSDASRLVMNPGAPAPKLKIAGSGKARIVHRRRPGIGDMAFAETTGEMANKVIMAVRVWDDVKRIDLIDLVEKKQTYAKEGVYFAFPFQATRPTFRYEAPVAIVNANRDMLPGACLDWFTVQHFVEVEGREATVAWATPDAPLACFQDINRGKWQTQLPMLNGHVYSYIMNNYWHTNYLAGQGGDMVFRYSITSRRKSDPVDSARFGFAVSNPLQAVVVGANPQGLLPVEATSLLAIDEPNVLLIGMKRADQGGGLIVRLWELSGRPTTAHLRLDHSIPAAKAEACNLVEEPCGPLELQDGRVAVPIRGSGLATVRID